MHGEHGSIDLNYIFPEDRRYAADLQLRAASRKVVWASFKSIFLDYATLDDYDKTRNICRVDYKLPWYEKGNWITDEVLNITDVDKSCI